MNKHSTSFQKKWIRRIDSNILHRVVSTSSNCFTRDKFEIEEVGRHRIGLFHSFCRGTQQEWKATFQDNTETGRLRKGQKGLCAKSFVLVDKHHV